VTEVPKAVTALAQGIAALHETIEELVEEWQPDPPPINTSMSAIGRSFVEKANPTSEQAAQVFERIEVLLREGTEYEKDAIATGFLEAVVSAIDRNPTSRWILDQAGPAAKAYIDEWNRFCGHVE